MKKKISQNSIVLMLKSFISCTLFFLLLFLMSKINVLIKDFLCLSLQKKDLFRYDSSHKTLETLYTT